MTKDSEQPLAGKRIVVTASRGRLGRALTRSMNAEGATVATIDRSGEEDAAGLEFIAELTDERAVEEVFARVESAIGPFDALIHTVGTWAAWPSLEHSLADWRRMMDTNLTSAFLCFREAGKRMVRHGGGRLIAFASSQGADRAIGGQAAYAAAKAGLIRLAESMADELEPGHVTTHVIAPSVILFDGEEDQPGVHASELAALCKMLLGPAGAALSGSTLRAYGRAH